MLVKECAFTSENLSLNEIENIVKGYQEDYKDKDFEININEGDGVNSLSLWLDDGDVEIHIMDIYPTRNELKLIDEKGICGTGLGHNLKCGYGKGSYDWMFGEKRCNACRECLKLIND